MALEKIYVLADSRKVFADFRRKVYTENQLSYLIRGAAFKVHSALGPGLLESVYETALEYELKILDLEVRSYRLEYLCIIRISCLMWVTD